MEGNFQSVELTTIANPGAGYNPIADLQHLREGADSVSRKGSVAPVFQAHESWLSDRLELGDPGHRFRKDCEYPRVGSSLHNRIQWTYLLLTGPALGIQKREQVPSLRRYNEL